jgi:hypothetical protein
MRILSRSSTNFAWTLHKVLFLSLGLWLCLCLLTTISVSPFLLKYSIHINIFLERQLEIFSQILALAQWLSRLLINFNNSDILTLSSQHQFLAQIVALGGCVLERRILFQFFDSVGITQRVQGWLTARESRGNVGYHCGFTVSNERIFQYLSKFTSSEWQMVVFTSTV